MAKYIVSTLLRNPGIKDNTIMITVAINGKRVLRYPSGFKAISKEKKVPENSVQTRKLSSMISDLGRFIERYSEDNNNNMPTKEELRAKLDELTNKSTLKKNRTIWGDLDKYICGFKNNVAGKRISPDTQRIRKQLKARLEEFNKQTTYNDINKSYVNGFATYLTERGLSNHSIALFISVFKSFLRTHAPSHIGRSYEEAKYQKLKTTKEQKAKRWALTWQEVKALEGLELDKELDFFRNAFLLLVYSSQRISDLDKIHTSNIEPNGGGIPVLMIEQQKTGSTAKVPITEHLQRILDRTGGEQITSIKYPYEMNRPLKRISKILFTEIARKEGKAPEIKNITSHTGRRTGATLMYYDLQIPISKIRSITGHTSELAFLRYLDPEADKEVESVVDAWKTLE